MAELSVHDRAVLNCIFNPSLPLSAVEGDINLELEDKLEQNESIERARSLENEAIQLAESGESDKAIDLLNRAIVIAPVKASLYNNRAQVYQLKKEFDNAFNDLTEAIKLSGDDQLRTKREALCQRGLLYRKCGKEDLAREDYAQAAQLGSSFAKSQLIELNPYAALCNQMLKQAFESLKD